MARSRWVSSPHTVSFPQRVRASVLRSRPICEVCGDRRSVCVDHVVPLAEGGSNLVENARAMCRWCHDRKTREEQIRGYRRYIDSAPRKNRTPEDHPGLF